MLLILYLPPYALLGACGEFVTELIPISTGQPRKSWRVGADGWSRRRKQEFLLASHWNAIP